MRNQAQATSLDLAPLEAANEPPTMDGQDKKKIKKTEKNKRAKPDVSPQMYIWKTVSTVLFRFV